MKSINFFSHHTFIPFLRSTYATRNLKSKFILEPHFPLPFSWRRSLSNRNQSIGLQSKSMGWFLYNRDLHHERVKKMLYRPILYRPSLQFLRHCKTPWKLAWVRFFALKMLYESFTTLSSLWDIEWRLYFYVPQLAINWKGRELKLLTSFNTSQDRLHLRCWNIISNTCFSLNIFFLSMNFLQTDKRI